MFSFLKPNKETDEKQNSSIDVPEYIDETDSQKGLFGRLKQRLSKTRSSFTEGISNALLGKKFQIPIRFIGVGESIDDLRPFNSKEFVSALLSRDNN